jgi:hypothetical protein
MGSHIQRSLENILMKSVAEKVCIYGVKITGEIKVTIAALVFILHLYCDKYFYQLVIIIQL